MEKTTSTVSAYIALLIVLAIVVGSLAYEYHEVDKQRKEVEKLTTAALQQKGLNQSLEKRLTALASEKGNIQVLWRRMNNSVHRFTLLPTQTRALYDIGVGNIEPVTADVGAEKKYFKFGGERAEFHRIVPGIVEFENSLVFAQIKQLKIELLPNVKPNGLKATYLQLDGEFSLPSEDRATTVEASTK